MLQCKRNGSSCAFVLLATLLAAHRPGLAADAPPPAPTPVAPGVYVVGGTGGEPGPANRGRVANAAFIVGEHGVVVVDSGGSYRHGEAIIAAIRRTTARPIRLVILTYPSQEVVFGAAAFQARGIPVLMHRDAAMLMAARCDACLRRLEETLGATEMARTRVVTPERTIAGTTFLDVGGTQLLLIAPRLSSAPGALAVLDQRTGTLMAGALVPVARVPDLRDSDGAHWRVALDTLRATRCMRLIPAFGPVDDCTAIDATDRYFALLDDCVRAAFARGVGLAEIGAQCELRAFADWDGYATLHRANASRAFLNVERAALTQ
jgi:glyoxylase-like metal-dependent hydrolase (beta-lactamase superfamily II)